MRKLLPVIAILFCFSSYGQGPQTTITISIDGSGGTCKGLQYLPRNYTTAKKYPLILCFPGAGEAADGGTAGTGVQKLYANSTSNTFAYFIATGAWPDSFRIGGTGAWEQPIVITPQASTWGATGAQIDFIINWCIANLSVDSTQIILQAISAGGEGTLNFISHNGVIPTHKASFVGLLSEAADINAVPQSFGTIAANDSVHAWGFGDPNGDIHGEATQDYIQFMNNRVPGIGRLTTTTTGHCCWRTQMVPTYKETIGGVSMNFVERALMFSQAAPSTPTANSGSNQTITLPTSSVTLTGSGTAGTGHTISSYGWTKISGPSTFTITSPSSSTTTVTGLVQGAYVFRLTVTNDASATATSDVTITVNPSTPVAHAGTDQSITLPTNSVTLDASTSTGTITSYAWTKISGPNSPTFGSASSVSTTVNGLIAGAYVFQISLNSGASTDQVQVTVNAAGGCRVGIKYTETPNGDTALCDGCSAFNHSYLPGDTIVIQHNPTPLNYWQYITFKGLNGSQGCPIVIQNDATAQTLIKGQVQLDGCTYIKFVGNGQPGQQYGFKIEYDKVIVPQVKSGMLIFDRSKNIEISNVDIHNVGTGIACLTDNNCDQTLDYPNWVLDSMSCHDSRIVMCWNESMYWANTSPDNANYDPREDQGSCTINAGGPTYSLPMQNGYMHIYNMIIDSAGRGGIQMAGNGGTTAISEIDHNVVTHTGLNQDDAQGTGISLGLYAKVYIHDNTVRNTYTWGIASLGGCSTNVPIRIENNSMDSIGFLTGWNRLSTTSDEFFIPATEPHTTDTLPWPYAVEIDIKPRIYTQASGGTPQSPPGATYGTAVKGQDSTQFWIINNTIGLTKAISRTPFSPGQRNVIQISDRAAQPGIQKIGNKVCGNQFFNGTAALAWADSSVNNISYSTSCSVGPPAPTVDAGIDRILLTPKDSLHLVGTTIGNGGNTISSRLWTKISGPNNPTITNSTTLTPTISGFQIGTYVFQLSATDSNSQTTTDTMQIIVKLGYIQSPIEIKVH